MLKIYIMTMGRQNEQHTYNLLPDFLKEHVVFVVRDFEADFFKSKYKSVVVCPDWVKNVSTTRKFVQQIAGKSYHWVMDDDLKILYHRDFIPGADQEWVKREATEEDWRTLCADIHSKIVEGYGLITMTEAGFIPSGNRFPFKEGLCGAQWFCMDGEKMSCVEWDAINLADDVDGCFQAISQGVRVGRFEKWLFKMGQLGAPGGCSTDRNVKTHAVAWLALSEKWPKYIRPRVVTKNYAAVSKYGDGSNQYKKFFLKAYKDYKTVRSST